MFRKRDHSEWITQDMLEDLAMRVDQPFKARLALVGELAKDEFRDEEEGISLECSGCVNVERLHVGRIHLLDKF